MNKKITDLRILLVGSKYGYGNPASGPSYEWMHVYPGIKDAFGIVELFDAMCALNAIGKEKMQTLLLNKVKEMSPDIIVIFLYKDEFNVDFIDSLRDFAKTISFFQDDSWRKDFVHAWAPYFDIFTTVDPMGVEQYSKKGLKNAVFMPFGVNENLFKWSPNVIKDIDVSFVGSWHPYREWLIHLLQKKGIQVKVYGFRWLQGAISVDEMVSVFQRSRISLNLSNSVSYDIRYLVSSPRAMINTIRSRKRSEQIKGRHFEISACNSMQLSHYVHGLEKVFKIGDEIDIYMDANDLSEKIYYYLSNDIVRENMSKNAYQRVMEECTYEKRFVNLFKQLKWVMYD